MKLWIISSLLCISSLIGAIEKPIEENLIRSIKVDHNTIKVEVHEQFKKKYLTSDFFAEYDNDIDLSRLDYSIQIMPFIMNVISIVWISGKTYYVDVLDSELYDSLKTVKKIIKKLYPRTSWKGKLIPRRLVTNVYTPVDDTKERVALLFSGGVDSTASSFYHRHKRQLLVTAWGHWDLPLGDKKLWETRSNHLKSFAKEYGHETTFIRSNYFSFLNRPVLDSISREIASWRIFVVEGIGWAGLVAPLLLLKGYPLLLHGSTISWDFPYPAAANPFIDNNLRFAGVGLKHDLFDINRLQKCSLIAKTVKKHHLKAPFIRVCEEKIVANCCHCQKCVRTILEFLVLGEDPRTYGFPIDFEKAMERTRKLIQGHGMVSTTVWHLQHIQDYLLAKKKRRKTVHPGFDWILALKLSNRKTFEMAHAQRVDWFNFLEFLPTIKVPKWYLKARKGRS